MHRQFREYVCLHSSGRVRTSTTIMIVHISYAGQGLKCNSQEQAFPPTSIKKNQSDQDEKPRYQVEQQSPRRASKLQTAQVRTLGKTTLSAQYPGLAFMLSNHRNVDWHRERPTTAGAWNMPG